MSKINENDKVFTTIKMLQNNGILSSNTKCYSNECDGNMKIVTRKRNQEGNDLYYLRCTISTCQKYRSLLIDSFFSLYKKPFLVILELIKFWCIDMGQTQVQDYLAINNIKISYHTINSIYSKLRNICSASVKSRKIKLGGVNKVVEIDETLLAKIKYNKGSGLKRPQLWLFGMVERGDSGQCFLQIVNDRTSKSLLRVIVAYVEKQTSIISDSWSSYNLITDLYYS